jgi:hypothetical protein
MRGEQGMLGRRQPRQGSAACSSFAHGRSGTSTPVSARWHAARPRPAASGVPSPWGGERRDDRRAGRVQRHRQPHLRVEVARERREDPVAGDARRHRPGLHPH